MQNSGLLRENSELDVKLHEMQSSMEKKVSSPRPFLLSCLGT